MMHGQQNVKVMKFISMYFSSTLLPLMTLLKTKSRKTTKGAGHDCSAHFKQNNVVSVLLVFWRCWWKFMYYIEFSKSFLAVGIVSKWKRHRGVFCSFETWSCPDVRKIKVLRPDLQSCEITPLRVAIATNFLALALTTPFHRVLRMYKGRSLCQNMHLVLRLYKECTSAEEVNIVAWQRRKLCAMKLCGNFQPTISRTVRNI